jgi:sulfate adenylyltransferase subunit 2
VEPLQRAIRKGQHMRVFPISNWTEMDVWQYIEREGIEVPSIYFAHERDVFKRHGMFLAVKPFLRCATARRSPR